ncbi:polysaccharide biosynthesis/export family protein [Avibacterium sp. 20-129]|uniref:polysaccharide biosynthesis/export family protein n=1 Tax=Avibacterium sp. 20-129 TaxID=2911525 RepID=UPI002246B5DE|nr:polysaccharide biosynthesis/export family protein [Avibacterium sp. 20-129]MCW9698301.1 polysaccharide export protein [Avibacterium sp. 20-129]
MNIKKKLKLLSIPMLTVIIGTSCSSLPTSGPSKSKVLGIEDNQKTPKVNLVQLDIQNVMPLYQNFIKQNFSEFSNSQQGYNGMVDIGDILDISIWEAPPAVLFGSTLTDTSDGSAKLTKLPEQMVNKRGRITIPFIGSITVKGKTPEVIQTEIVRRLSSMANHPQAIVRVVQNNSANVSVIRQGNSIRMPLTSHGERVLDAIAAVGGVQADIQDVSIQLTRGTQVKSISFESLVSDPSQNIPLRSGDVLTLLNSPLSFTGLGAVGTNRQIKFSTKGLSLAEAIGQMGGLIDTRSDPSGVFVFRYTPFNKLSLVDQDIWRSRGYDNGMDVPTVYQIDLLKPKSLFVLQRFPIQDKDVIYVSNAPLAEFQKFLRMIFSITSPVTSTINSVNNL